MGTARGFAALLLLPPSWRRRRVGMRIPPVLTGLTIAAIAAIAIALPSDITPAERLIVPAAAHEDTTDSWLTPAAKKAPTVSKDPVAEDPVGSKAFIEAFAKLDAAATKHGLKAKYHVTIDIEGGKPKEAPHPSLNPHAINLESDPYTDFKKNLAKPPSTPISDISPETAAAVATDKRTAATTSLAFEKYKHSPFALKVVGKDKKAKLKLTNPSAFSKLLKSILKAEVKIEKVVGPKKGGALGEFLGAVGMSEEAKQTALEAFACSKKGKSLRKVYNDAMGFWNGQGHEIYGKLCSSKGGRCAAANKIVLPYTFKGVAEVPIPSEITRTWFANKMDCTTPKMEIAKQLMAKHSGATPNAAPWTLLCVTVPMALWGMWRLA